LKKCTYILLFLVMFLFFLPAATLFFASFFDGNILKNSVADANFSFMQYANVLKNESLLRNFRNSFLISFSVLMIQFPASVILGYALSRFKGRFAIFIKCTLAVSLLLPFESIMVPVFRLGKWLNLYDRQLSVILLETFSPVSFLFVSLLISSVDADLINAASLDTDSDFRIFTKIIFPLILPGICVLTLLCFSESWNLTEPALILLPDERLRPASVAINDISERSQASSYAASVLYSLPVVLVYLPLASTLLRKESII